MIYKLFPLLDITCIFSKLFKWNNVMFSYIILVTRIIFYCTDRPWIIEPIPLCKIFSLPPSELLIVQILLIDSLVDYLCAQMRLFLMINFVLLYYKNLDVFATLEFHLSWYLIQPFHIIISFSMKSLLSLVRLILTLLRWNLLVFSIKHTNFLNYLSSTLYQCLSTLLIFRIPLEVSFHPLSLHFLKSSFLSLLLFVCLQTKH